MADTSAPIPAEMARATLRTLVNRERTGSKQAGERTEVIFSHCERAASLGIGGYRLQVGEKDRKEDGDNRGRNPTDVSGGEDAQWQQDSHGRFGAVGSGAKSVQTQHRNGASRSYLFDLLLFGAERSAKEQLL